MAHKKTRRPISSTPPTAIPGSGSFQPTSGGASGDRVIPQVIASREVWFFSNEAGIVVGATLRGPARRTDLARPKYAVIDRPGRTGILDYQGRDPVEMTVPIRFNKLAGDGSVVREVRALTSLTEEMASGEPPDVQITGPLPWVGMTFRVVGLTIADPEKVLHNSDGEVSFIEIDVLLQQKIDDRITIQTASQGGKGSRQEKAEIRKGETLFEFAKRVLRDRSKADEVARANSLHLGFKAKKDMTLRLPR
jgi:hypothetical protein